MFCCRALLRCLSLAAVASSGMRRSHHDPAIQLLAWLLACDLGAGQAVVAQVVTSFCFCDMLSTIDRQYRQVCAGAHVCNCPSRTHTKRNEVQLFDGMRTVHAICIPKQD